MDNKMAVSMTGTSWASGFSWKKHISITISNYQGHAFVCILISQTPNQNGMKRQGKPLPSWAQICPVSAWEKFLAWSYKPVWIGVYNGSAILTLSAVALVLCCISAPSICEILICPMAGNWGDGETQEFLNALNALNYLNLSVLGFYWHKKWEDKQWVRGSCQTDEWLNVYGRRGNRLPHDCPQQSPDYFIILLPLQETCSKIVHGVWRVNL